MKIFVVDKLKTISKTRRRYKKFNFRRRNKYYDLNDSSIDYFFLFNK